MNPSHKDLMKFNLVLWKRLTSFLKHCRSEKIKIGSAMSGALVTTLIGLAASNLGIISSEAPAFCVMMNFLLPLAVPLLLFRADLRRVIQSTGKLLFAFLIGSCRIYSPLLHLYI